MTVLSVRTHVVCSTNGVGAQECDDLGGGEASTVSHAGKNLVDRVKRKGNGPIWGGLRAILAALQELKAWGTRTVGDTDSASELDEVGDGDTRVAGNKLLLEGHNLVSAAVLQSSKSK